jgi:hypothetical protein
MKSRRLLFLFEQTDGDLDYGFLSLFIDFLHLLTQVVLQIQSVLLGVDVDLA